MKSLFSNLFQKNKDKNKEAPKKESFAAMNTAELRSLIFECDWAEIITQSGSPDLFLQPYGL